MVRMAWMSNSHFSFLVWNLFLAWIPFLISWQMRLKQNKLIHYSLFALWLLFLPNAPYIVTDLVHLKQHENRLLFWYDMMLLFSFAWNGLILGFLSINRIHAFMNVNLNRQFAWLIVFILLFLCAYGVYLGRFERFNSWDLFTNPVLLIADIFNDLKHPWRNRHAFAFSILVSILLVVVYATLIFIKNHKNHLSDSSD